MFDPLMLIAHSDVQVELYDGIQPERFICTKIEHLQEQDIIFLTRYQLQSVQTQRQISLDVTKDQKHDFHFMSYELVEKKSFNASFLSILGTTTLGYSDPSVDKQNHTLYQYLPHKKEKIEVVKYIADPEELGSNLQAYGYNKDANGQWYCLVSISHGNVKHFSKTQKRRSWEYEANQENRLLIEINESLSIKHRNIYIYQGFKLQRRDIHLIQAERKSEQHLLKNLLAQPQKFNHTIVPI